MPVVLRWLLTLLGPANPIAVRLVQSGSRRRKHLFVRAAYLAVLIVVLLWWLLLGVGGDPSYRELARAGAEAFVAIAYLQIGLICILAPVFMASAIAQEANPRTWDILLTTPLGPGQIVLGNLIGRLFFILALLFSSLPLFALTQYFGGVPGRSIFASYLVAGSAALLVGSVAIALSVSRLVGRRAVFAFYIAVVTYLAATIAVDALLRNGGLAARGASGVTWMTGLNPFLALRALLNPATYPRAEDGSLSGLSALFLESPVAAWVALSTVVSLLLMGVSAVTVRAGGLQAIARPGPKRRHKVVGTPDEEGTEFRAPRSVSHNPIAWREASARNATFWRILARWSFVAVGLLGGIAVILALHIGGIAPDQFRLILLATVWTEAMVVALIAINMASTAVSREREDGTLDILLTTPITPSAYLAGKLRGLVTYLAPLLLVPVGTLLFAGIYVAAGGFGNQSLVQEAYQFAPSAFRTGGAAAMRSGVAPLVLPEASFVALLTIAPFTALCVIVGLHWSLKSKGTISSVVGAVAVIGVAGGIVGLCGMQSGADIQMLGPVLAALNPATALHAALDPIQRMETTVASGPVGLTNARWGLVIGALLSALIHLAVVWALHAAMVKGFDSTVRKLAGSR